MSENSAGGVGGEQSEEEYLLSKAVLTKLDEFIMTDLAEHPLSAAELRSIASTLLQLLRTQQ